MPITDHLQYTLLADKPEWLEIIAEWNQKQWGYLRPGSDVSLFINRFKDYLNRDKLPLIYVAFIKKSIGVMTVEEPIGMFALTEDIYKMGYEKIPMLNNVYVVDKYREKGIGTWLINLAEEKASELGYKDIFLFTSDDSLNGFYMKLNWTLKKEGFFLDDKKVWIFDKPLKNEHVLTYKF